MVRLLPDSVTPNPEMGSDWRIGGRTEEGWRFTLFVHEAVLKDWVRNRRLVVERDPFAAKLPHQRGIAEMIAGNVDRFAPLASANRAHWRQGEHGPEFRILLAHGGPDPVPRSEA